MGNVLDRLAERKLLVSDGAWGTLLQEKGLGPGDAPELWNVTHPDLVEEIARSYIDAGSDMILTNTFGASRIKLEGFGLAAKTQEINRRGAELSRRAAADRLVAGSVGPTGVFLQPYGEFTEEQLQEVFEEQIAALLEGGVDAICIETMIAIEEALCAIRAARKVSSDVDIIVTMTFDRTAVGYRTMMGVDCKRAAIELTEAGADIVGSNCGNGIEQMVEIVGEFRRYTERPILVHPNAGLPELVDGKTVFRQGPEEMAAYVERLVDAGASIIGGCCGTRPEHIRAIRREIDRILQKTR